MSISTEQRERESRWQMGGVVGGGSGGVEERKKGVPDEHMETTRMTDWTFDSTGSGWLQAG